MAIFWLVLGLLFAILAGSDYMGVAVGKASQGEDRRYIVLMLFLSSWYVVVPIGLLLRTRWSWYGGMMLSFMMLLAFPIGTIFGGLTIKALLDCRDAFGVR